MQRLVGGVISVAEAQKTSESLEDAARSIGQYTEAIVLRHPKTGVAKKAADASPIPIINPGDGTGEDPTQALATRIQFAPKRKMRTVYVL